MGVEEGGGPSEEDLRIRTEAGEPESRVSDFDLSRRRAKLSQHFRKSAERKIGNAEVNERVQTKYHEALENAPETDDPNKNPDLKTKQELQYELADRVERSENDRSSAKKLASVAEQAEGGGWDEQMEPGRAHDWIDTKRNRPPEVGEPQ